MKNWSTNTQRLKADPKKFAVWKLEQLVNFGLDGKKLSILELKKHWHSLHLDPDKKKYLYRLLHA